MTRDIIDIYNDIIDLGLPTEGFTTSLNFDSFENHYQDNQVVSNNLLKWMYDSVLKIRPFYGKTTYGEFLSVETVYSFNSTWWDLTVAQAAERDSFLKGIYLRDYNRTFASGLWIADRHYLLDENNNFEQWKDNAGLLYQGFPLVSSVERFSVKRPDQWRMEDLFDLTTFYDPSLVRIERLPDLNTWLDNLDAGIIKLRDQSILLGGDKVSDNFRRINGNQQTHKMSDIIEIDISFSAYSATVDQQDIFFQNQTSGQNETTTIYSNDGGEGLPIVDPITGLAFGSTAEDFHNWITANWVDTFDADRLKYDYNFSVVNVNGTNYNDENYFQNFSTNAKSNVTDDIYYYNLLGSEFNVDYTASIVAYETKAGQNEWDAVDFPVVSSQDLEVAKVGEILNTTQDTLFINAYMPVYPAVDALEYSKNYKTVNSLDFSYTTTIDLTPPV
jgi:hypothetical protein